MSKERPAVHRAAQNLVLVDAKWATRAHVVQNLTTELLKVEKKLFDYQVQVLNISDITKLEAKYGKTCLTSAREWQLQL